MRSILSASLIVALSLVLFSCHKTTIGYLQVEQAGYSMDSLVIKLKLDTTPPTLAPNPTYQALLNFGYTPAAIAALGILPTIPQNAGVDYDRNRLGIPWTSTPLEGLEGTMPITITFTHITTDIGDIAKLTSYMTVRNNGVITIPLQNDIPAGHYILSFQFKNEGYTKVRNNIFTVIVK